MSSSSNLAAQHAAAFFVLGLLEGTGVSVRFGGGPCYARQDNVIWFPNYPTLVNDDSAPGLQHRLNRLYRAIAMHESGHPLYTSDERNSGTLGFHLWMSLEDVRCDSLNQARHLGAKQIFEQGYAELIAEGMWKPASSDQGLVPVFAAWVLFRARHLIAGQQCFGQLAASSHDALLTLVDQADVDTAWSIVSLTRTARTSVDIVRVVDRLLAWLKDQLDAQEDSPPPQPEPDQQPSDESSDVDDANQDPQGSACSEDPSGDSSDSSHDPDPESDDATAQPGCVEDEDDQDQPPNQSPISSSGEDADGDDTSPTAPSCGTAPGEDAGADSDVGRSLTNADIARIDAHADELPDDVGSALASAFHGASQQAVAAGATWSAIPQTNRMPPSSTPYIGDADTRPFSIRLTRLLRTRSTASVIHDRRGERLDPQALVRWRLGERDIFVEESDVRLVDTALMVVVDESPSMAEKPPVRRGEPDLPAPIDIARSAALRLCKALSEVPGTSVSAISFPDVNDDGRFEGVRTLLPFGGAIKSFARHFLDLDAKNRGSTPLHLALTKARYELLRRTQPRRICVVMTDGEPDRGPELVRPILDLMARDGIEVIALGIKTMAVETLFARHKVIHDLAELEPALFELLQSVLLSRRAA